MPLRGMDDTILIPWVERSGTLGRHPHQLRVPEVRCETPPAYKAAFLRPPRQLLISDL